MGNTMEKIRYGKKRRLIHVAGKERMPFRLLLWRINTDMLEQIDLKTRVIENYKDGSLREN
jgi:hypothetical protein